MFEISQDRPTRAFTDAFMAAGRHIEARGQGAISWHRSAISGPLLEHLSFSIGNGLFFVYIVAADGSFTSPGDPEGFRQFARSAKAVPCFMPMQRAGDAFMPCERGWGFVDDPVDGRLIDTESFVGADAVEMSDWEVHDFGNEIVRRGLVKDGRRVMSWVAYIGIDPSLWFEGDTGPEWVVVRAVRYPVKEAVRPPNLADIGRRCLGMGRRGHFASVSIANADDAFDGLRPMPLLRGHGMFIRYEGLEEVFQEICR